MSTSEDIQNLFGKFDGTPQQYQEVARDDQAGEARSRWPLLSSLALNEAGDVPEVPEPGSARGHASPPVSGPLARTELPDALRRLPSSANDTGVGTRASGGASPDAGARSLPWGLQASVQPSGQSSVQSIGTPMPEMSAAPASAFSPPRAPAPRPEPLPFMRESAPAFRVRTGPVHADASQAQAARGATDFPPVVTPQTSKRRAPDAVDFAPPVVPVNHFKPSASPITGVEPDRRGVMSTEPSPIPSGSILGKLFARPAEPETSARAEGARDLGSVFGRLVHGRRDGKRERS
ncbi:cellulose biosynthesis protein BcsP [Pararobbsia silviterrae]|uniref:Cellulose biosynthesis protein BcsR n=1 Tax=Pararobbsia silviterrae TaxID=1792498 RepID=A0A494XI58_9BURK|nr:cellulose biosynthesis protein BcsP [Pararobbsia silviterrae]RKP47764.1 hypothetical protein D7S86_22660 [Pararobbsia silviterrae]